MQQRTLAFAILFWVALLPTQTYGEALTMRVIPLSYRPLAEVLPLLEPLVPKPGTVTGIGDRLVVKTTPENLREVQRVLAEIDRAPRNLLILVKQTRTEGMNANQAEADVRIRQGDVTISTGRSNPIDRGASATYRGGDTEASVRVLRTQSDTDDDSLQRVRVLEGHEAFITTGELVPFADCRRRGRGLRGAAGCVSYKEVTTGFYVVPRLSGERVLLDVAPQRMGLSERGGGVVDVQQAYTTVSGQLGRWIEIAGASRQQNQTEHGTLSYRTRSNSDAQTIFLKVELLQD
jgi:hypothetical protein